MSTTESSPIGVYNEAGALQYYRTPEDVRARPKRAGTVLSQQALVMLALQAARHDREWPAATDTIKLDADPGGQGAATESFQDATPPAFEPGLAEDEPPLAGSPPESLPVVASDPVPAAVVAEPPAPLPSWEAPVDPVWLQRRDDLLNQLALDYWAQQREAQSRNPADAWETIEIAYGGVNDYVETRTVLKDGHSAELAPGWSRDPVSYDEVGRPNPPQFQFSDARFREHYLALDNPTLQALATHFDQPDVATLLRTQPILFQVALELDRGVGKGLVPAGQANASAETLFAVDLALLDPDFQALKPRVPASWPALTTVAYQQTVIYGPRRYAEMEQLMQVMALVRNDYNSAVRQARSGAEDGPGWIDAIRLVEPFDIDGPAVEPGTRIEVPVRRFDIAAFTEWYLLQDKPEARLFAAYYGPARTEVTGLSDEGDPTGPVHFAARGWSFDAIRGIEFRSGMAGVNLNNPPGLNDPTAIRFDPAGGWLTDRGNVIQSIDWFEVTFQAAFVGFVAWASGGIASQLLTGLSGTTAGSMAIAAVGSVGGSVVSGALNDNLTLKGVLKGALRAALTAGLTRGLDRMIANSDLGGAGAVAKSTLAQGLIAEIDGGDFGSGAFKGLIGGLSREFSDMANDDLKNAFVAGEITDLQFQTGQQAIKVVTSAIAMAGSEGHPGQILARLLVSEIIKAALPSYEEIAQRAAAEDAAADAHGEATDPETADVDAADGHTADAIDPADTDALFDGGDNGSTDSGWMQEDLEQLTGLVAGDAYLLDTGAARVEFKDDQGRVVAEVERDGIRARLYHVDPDSGARTELIEAPLTALDDDLILTGGRSPVRIDRTVQMVRSDNREQLLDSLTSVGDLFFGLADVRAAVADVEYRNAEAGLERLKTTFKERGLPIPTTITIAGDTSRIDFTRTLQGFDDTLKTAALDERMTKNWGKGWQNLRFGNQQWTASELEQKFHERYQKAIDVGYGKASKAYNAGLISGLNRNQAIGSAVDEAARSEMRAWANQYGLRTDSGSRIEVLINTYLANPNGSDYRIPDARVGSMTLLDASLAWKMMKTPQVRDFFRFTHRDIDLFIMRPTALGGSYMLVPLHRTAHLPR